MRKIKRSAALTILLLLVAALSVIPAARAVSPDIVISQVYGGGGNSGATYTHDFIELFNRGSSPVSLAGWSVQYTSATGTGNFGANSGQLTELPAVSLAPGQYLLIQEAQGAGGTTPLPTPDVVDGTPINMSATAGKVALVSSSVGLGCNGGSTPCSPAQLALIVDLIGYGSANFFEGTAAPGLSNTTAALRAGDGCTDTDNNGSDFTAGSPTPRNTATPLNPCSAVNQPVIADCGAALNLDSGTAGSANVSASDADGTVISLLINSVTPSPAPGSISMSGLTPAGAPGGTASAVVNVDALVPAGSYTVQIVATNNDSTPQTGTCNLTVNIAELISIPEIQGADHLSAFDGQIVITKGIVTAKASNGFYLQDPVGDGDDATSDAIFVFTGGAPTVDVGDEVRITATVDEFRPGGSGGLTNLTITELVSPGISVLSSGNALPAPVVIGSGGRVPPGTVIDDDATGSVESSGSFDAASDGIDFYESLEAMRVQINNAVAVGPTNNFGEIAVVGDNGANSGLLSPRGAIVIQPGDFNPERVFLDDGLLSTPVVNTGDSFSGPLVGVLSYSFGNFKLYITAPVNGISGGLAPETAVSAVPGQLSVATFNVENLDPNDPPAKFAGLAGQIVNRLRAPDIIGLEEVQDNNGPTNNGVVDAVDTYNALIAAIQAAGGPLYEFRQVNPVNNADGGEPGGNIRVGFLFRTDRGLAFVDRPGGGPTTATTVALGPSGVELSSSPGRIAPTDSAFDDSRKPLVGEFLFNGQKVFVILNHFNSKGGDQPLFGRFQPPTLFSEAQRLQQAQIVNAFVDSLLALDETANVIVMGDLNDFPFSAPLAVVAGDDLTNLVSTLPPEEQYTYLFDGNAQVLDHMLVSESLLAAFDAFDIVHGNAEFAVRDTDHDPVLAYFTIVRPIQIDIRPGDVQNTINLKSNGKLDVAILSSADFDATSVNPATVILAGAEVARRPNGSLFVSIADVNHDQLDDLLLKFEVNALQLTPVDTQAALTGQTYAGFSVAGADSVRIVPPPAPEDGSPDSTVLNTSTPTLTWQEVDGAACYIVEVADNPSLNSPLQQAIVDDASFTTWPLSNGSYVWHVAVSSCTGEVIGKWSNKYSFTVQIP